MGQKSQKIYMDGSNLISSSMLTLPLIPDAHAARRDVSPTGPHQCTQDTARLAKTIFGKQIL